MKLQDVILFNGEFPQVGRVVRVIEDLVVAQSSEATAILNQQELIQLNVFIEKDLYDRLVDQDKRDTVEGIAA